jgi:hypothetical protein
LWYIIKIDKYMSSTTTSFISPVSTCYIFRSY